MGKTYRSWQSRAGYKNSRREKVRRRRMQDEFSGRNDKKFRFDPKEYR